jgi:predicted metal-dependent phosphoesterase TrpH
MTATVRLDLHVHSTYSVDGRVDLESVVNRLGVAGLQGFALTDHNSVNGHARLKELRARYPMYWFVPGVEVSTKEGHLLVYGVPAVPPVHRALAETLDWVRDHNAVAVLAHPFRWWHGVGRALATTARADGIETVNGHNAEVSNARAELVAASRGVAATGGSDAHFTREVGSAYTEFPADVESLEDVLSGLRRGRTHGAGRGLAVVPRIRVSIRSGLLRAARGFRPV